MTGVGCRVRGENVGSKGKGGSGGGYEEGRRARRDRVEGWGWGRGERMGGNQVGGGIRGERRVRQDTLAFPRSMM
jgi:hypothetical protein